MLIPKRKYVRSPKHLAFIRSLPCCVSSAEGSTEPAHIRKGTDGATGRKPSDFWTVPLSALVHRDQHQKGEVTFWEQYGGIEKAKKLAADLYAVSGDFEAGKQLVEGFLE